MTSFPHAHPARSVGLALLVVAALTVPASLQAQNVVLDEGTFTLLLNGEEAGTETFTIRRIGSGSSASILANGVVRLQREEGASEMRPVLKAGADRAPVRYENMIEGEDVSSVIVSAADRHYIATIRSTAGQREKELRAREGALFLDRFVAHHHYFVASLAREGATIPVVVPRTGDPATLTVESVTTTTFRIGTEEIEARRIELRLDGESRTLWVDDQGRVLQVEIPALGYRAVRETV